MKFSIYVLLLSLVSGASQAQLAAYVPASLNKEVKANYPRDRYADSDETSVDDGLVELSFMVDEQGKTFAPVVVRASMEKFVEPALRALSNHQYQPASVNGKVVQAALRKTFAFKLSAADLRSARGSTSSFTNVRERGVPDGFQSFYDEFAAELGKPEPDQALMASLLERMIVLKHQSFYSLAYHALARYRFAEKFGGPMQKMSALRDLVWFDPNVKKKYRILKEEFDDAIWSTVLKLDIESGHYAEALATYSKIHSDKPALAKPFSAYIEQIEAMRQGEQVTQRSIELSDESPTLVPLLKNSFTFAEVKGEIQQLTLRCQAKFAELAYQPQAQYDLPQSWGDCELQVVGAVGTSAKLFEL